MPKTTAFDNYSDEYENWFTRNHFVFQSELEAVKKAMLDTGDGIEIGIGSGIFAKQLGIKEGVEPSDAMRKKAVEKGINAINGVAENLPYDDNSKDFVVMITSICFVDDINKSFKEISRVLKSNGSLILAFVDKDSPVGKMYLENKDKSLFYKDALFRGTEELYEVLKSEGFTIENTYQTIIGEIEKIDNIQ
ncbi:MAG: class I SAM-dependent methyltransferase [Bacteroidales bacterium]|jgi:ubiquinone/menaquinone biosynthesis C-methylase UbiE|nr:class I SAM-dependent methyltransferase [Bacteroidales bacterium]